LNDSPRRDPNGPRVGRARWLSFSSQVVMEKLGCLKALGSYAKLVDYTGRLFRQGKASISAELAGIFERLNCSTQSWHKRMERLGGDRLLGRFFASTRAKLREIGERPGVRHLVNLMGCPLR
jgi:hypothetical protein